MKILKIEPGKVPYMKEISKDLDALQKEVGGDIQAIYPYEDMVAIICNDEGKLLGLPLNRALYMDEEMYDIIAGDFFICGIVDGDIISLSDELAKKYYEQFKAPETFCRSLNDEIIALKDENAAYGKTLDLLKDGKRIKDDRMR